MKQPQEKDTGISPNNTKSKDAVVKQGPELTTVTNTAVDILEQQPAIRHDENKPQQPDAGKKDDTSLSNKGKCLWLSSIFFKEYCSSFK